MARLCCSNGWKLYKSVSGRQSREKLSESYPADNSVANPFRDLYPPVSKNFHLTGKHLDTKPQIRRGASTKNASVITGMYIYNKWKNFVFGWFFGKNILIKYIHTINVYIANLMCFRNSRCVWVDLFCIREKWRLPKKKTFYVEKI